MRYVNQRKHPHMLYVTKQKMDEKNREHGKTTTIYSSGCGLCSAIMVADRLLPYYQFDLYDSIELSYAAKANEYIGTDFDLFAPVFAEKLGLRYEVCADVEGVRQCLRTGGAVVVLVGGSDNGHKGIFCRAGHYMTIIGEEPDGRFAILDPAFDHERFKEQGMEEIRAEYVEVKNDVITLCDADVLHEETTGKSGPYYLFWRA